MKVAPEHEATPPAVRGDVVIIGAGPAGLLLAVQCARRGLNVVILAEDSSRPWDRQLSTWERELPSDFPDAWKRTVWTSVLVAGSVQRVVDAAYVALDSDRMQSDL